VNEVTVDSSIASGRAIAGSFRMCNAKCSDRRSAVGESESVISLFIKPSFAGNHIHSLTESRPVERRRPFSWQNLRRTIGDDQNFRWLSSDGTAHSPPLRSPLPIATIPAMMQSSSECLLTSRERTVLRPPGCNGALLPPSSSPGHRRTHRAASRCTLR
jgi:hypothetical protein